jgi:ATP-binding cassette subfamily F protein uup
VEYKGTLLLVSHDREFIDNTVTSTLVFEGPGEINEYVGGYQDWLRQRPGSEAVVEQAPASQKPSRPSSKQRSQQNELRTLPGKIEKIEEKIEVFQQRFGDADYYQQEPELIRDEQQQLQALESDLAVLYQRWEALEGD